MNATNYGRNITITKGQTRTLDLAADLGLGRNYNSGMGSWIDGQTYTVSDATALSIVPHEYVYSSLYSGSYYTYDITPQKTGSYTFVVNFYYTSNHTSSTNTCTYNITVVDVIAITIPSNLSMFIGEVSQITPTIAQPGATTTLTWQSSSSSVATVTEDGVVTALSKGVTIISCIAANGVSAQCEVTVSPVEVSSIALNQTEAELVAGEKVQLTATASPDNATDKTVTWSSTNEAVAVVSESGQVTAVGAGTCQIKATANDGSGKTASCLVTVLGNVLYCEDFGAVPGATVTLPVQLTNADAIQGFEFKLVLPSGVSVETDVQGKLAATLTDRASTQGLEGSNQGSGVYQFVFTSTNRLQGNSGAIVNVPLVVDDNVAVGQYPIVVKDVELVKYGTSAQIYHSDRTATLTIKEKTLGDVTGDGRVSVGDAIAIINYVLGRNPVSFIATSADVNHDGDISLADAVATVDIILAGGGAGARALVRSIMNLDPQ